MHLAALAIISTNPAESRGREGGGGGERWAGAGGRAGGQANGRSFREKEDDAAVSRVKRPSQVEVDISGARGREGGRERESWRGRARDARACVIDDVSLRFVELGRGPRRRRRSTPHREQRRVGWRLQRCKGTTTNACDAAIAAAAATAPTASVAVASMSIGRGGEFSQSSRGAKVTSVQIPYVCYCGGGVSNAVGVQV